MKAGQSLRKPEDPLFCVRAGQGEANYLEKDAGRYNKALQTVNEILKDDPDIPVAAFTKAAILWEGFKDSYTAKLGLERIKQLVPHKNDKLNRMASELVEKIERPNLRNMD